MGIPDSSSRKILFVTHAYPDWPGAFRGHLVYRMAVALHRQGFQVHVLTPRIYGTSFLKEESEHGIQVHRFVYPSGNRMLMSFQRVPMIRMALFFITAFIKGWQLTRQHKYRLIHAHWIVPLGPIAIILGKLKRIPVVLQAHGSDVHTYGTKNRLLKVISRFAIRHSTCLLAVSKNLLPGLTALNGRPIERFEHLPPFVDGDMFSPAIQGIDSKTILFAGGLFENKGIRELLQAAEKFLSVKNDFHVTFLGDGPLRASILRWAAEKGYGKRITLTGTVPYHEMPGHLQNALVLVLPSFREGMPSIILEALACGTPCIASCVGDIPSIIRQEENGLLIPPGSPEDIAAAVLWLGNDGNLYSKLKANARSSVLPYLSSSSVERLIEIYEDISFSCNGKLNVR